MSDPIGNRPCWDALRLSARAISEALQVSEREQGEECVIIVVDVATIGAAFGEKLSTLGWPIDPSQTIAILGVPTSKFVEVFSPEDLPEGDFLTRPLLEGQRRVVLVGEDGAVTSRIRFANAKGEVLPSVPRH